MISMTGLCRASTKRGAIRGDKRNDRGGFISSLALQLGQTRFRHALKFKNDEVVTSFLQVGQIAIDQSPCALALIVPPN
jgi:hypothetical protein